MPVYYRPSPLYKLFEPGHDADKPMCVLFTPAPARVVNSPFLTAKEAADYLRLSYSSFRKVAVKVVRQPGTRKYRKEDLDKYAEEYRHRKRR